MRGLPRAHATQGLGARAFARREHGANPQAQPVLEHRLGAQRRKGSQPGEQRVGPAQPPLPWLGGNRQELLCPAFSLQSSAMDKVELMVC